MSVDNLHKREPEEVRCLLDVIETLVTERLTRPDTGWRVQLAGYPRVRGTPHLVAAEEPTAGIRRVPAAREAAKAGFLG